MKKVATSVSEGVAHVILNNPERHNAFDDQIIASLLDSFVSVAGNPEVRVMVLKSVGKNFSAGADLNWMKRMAGYSFQENLRDAEALSEMYTALHRMPLPTIVRVQGAAMGGALGLISCCDIALAETDASFALSEVRIGLIPATISPYVVAAIGPRASRRYFTSGERFNATRALELGLVSEVLDREDMDEHLEKLINSILANGPEAVKAAKALVNNVASRVIDQELIDYTCKLIANIRVSQQGQEGLSAFLEKRKPNWP